jgi:transaldolase
VDPETYFKKGRANVKALDDLRVRLFADGADRDEMALLAANPLIRGFTTNPTLMRKAGVEDYGRFAQEIVGAFPQLPISLEVFSDEFGEMERQARELASLGENVFVKIPVMNSRGEPSGRLVERLSRAGLRLNVTALMTSAQVEEVCRWLRSAPAAYVSVFAGRVADTGRDPVPIITEAVELANAQGNAEVIWASPRELLNLFQADDAGCHIITATSHVLAKLDLVGKDLIEFSRETVQMFHDDARASGYVIEEKRLSLSR